ncbi:MAG: 2-C-methyl-D-erythritol 4-phosphate cytidylyltransferase [Lachnospiraceae bacterium]|nr:2-C-methyl-D-erythritol 4-phosphate cytidylyltransferase [Lachnospiraceae bacterium]
MKPVCKAIVVAAGSGRRMGGKIPKQFLPLSGKPVLWYSLQAFGACDAIEEIILVTAEEFVSYCREEIVERYQLDKVKTIVTGGAERTDSVYQGLLGAEPCDYVMIHDGARPFLSDAILDRCMEKIQDNDAIVVGVPARDTVKIADAAGFVKETPERKTVWIIQTPQVFSYSLIRKAYEEMYRRDIRGLTDDAMVVEQTTGESILLVEGSSRNIKITTPEDLIIAESFMQR